jgi:hypothetical protein
VNAISIAPVQWSTLENIDDVTPIQEDDAPCLAEIRDVLKRHGKLTRFGVALLHSHFDLAEDEIMLETSDPASRRLVTQPTKLQEAGGSNVGTIWMLREGDVTTMSWCASYCKRLPISNTHDPRHRKARD